ncbi:dicarboxylate/amino acid:cation symporter [Endozoicomonas sp. SM1973]|uniref:Dicarboxylate/amino acid:cation symporter n=1 Tax=Spartinivicinus marinus TaxID=2994442 RepID=A0A853I6K6_9GAMM|nr:dicarboxylate/amino acid:cation symporter [Spartinivicinus marinus]MCX4027770.1 dicarboxylate/amino acid:cation symporter [Spartinivicinus marinus]NYZ68953.1 dicarboxylate/amino acid:cation symporter [Spartinivicinus marinus]
MSLSQLEKQLPSFRLIPDALARLVEGRLWVKVLIGLGLGIIVGILLGPDLALFSKETSLVIVGWLALPGKLFIAMVQMIVVPLVFTSIIRGLTSTSDLETLKRMGIRCGLFFVVTTAIASVIGLTIAGLINPGDFVDRAAVKVSLMSEPAPPAVVNKTMQIPSIAELPHTLLNLLPVNPAQSMVHGEMLQVILFATIIGIALLNLATKKSEPIFNLMISIQELCMKIVSWAMVLAPYAVFGLIARLTAMVGIEILAGMFVYMLTVILGLAILCGCYLFFIKSVSGIIPKHFIKESKELLLMAFSTSSSAAVMPLSLETAENKLNIPPHIAKFVIPLGATVNMTGTALYQSIAVVFLSQVFSVQLDTMSYALVVFMSVAASIGSPATPGAGIIILAMILESVGIPSAGVALLLGVDRILDMMRTTVNVVGDLAACIFLKENQRIAGLANANQT